MSELDIDALDAWIHINLFNGRPRMEAQARSHDDKGIALYEHGIITREDVKCFCQTHPQWKYVEKEIYPNYTGETCHFASLLKLVTNELCKDCCSLRIAIIPSGDTEITSHNTRQFGPPSIDPVLGVALGLFARKLFEKKVWRESEQRSRITN